MNNNDFSWDYDEIIRNQFDNIMPFIESTYNASTESSGRAYAGLSMGGLTTSMMYYNHASDFDYFGIWSGAISNIDLTGYENLDEPTLMIGAGIYDFAYDNDRGGISVVEFTAALDEIGIDYGEVSLVPGGHDWATWPQLFTIFARDVLWQDEDVTETGFELVTQVEEYGQVVSGVIIDTGGIVNASDIDANVFNVYAENYNPATGGLAYSGDREVTDAYVKNTKELGDTGETNGRYIVLELKYGYTVSGCTSLAYIGRNISLDLNYTITTDGSIDIDSFVLNGVINSIVDDFDLINYNDQFMRLYSTNSDEALPLVLWNHGIGETYSEEYDNEGVQIMANMGGVAWVQDEYPCYVLAPQRGTGTNYSHENVISLIDELVEEGKVDPNRIYVTGCSAGGAETMSYMRNYPDYFAAAAPICPASTFTDEQAELVKDMPMWFFHSADDPSISVDLTRSTVEQLSALDPYDLKYTEFENLPYSEDGTDGFYNGHWSWVPVLNN